MLRYLEDVSFLQHTFQVQGSPHSILFHPSGAFALVTHQHKIQAFDSYSLALIAQTQKNQPKTSLIFSSGLNCVYLLQDSTLYKWEIGVRNKLSQIKRISSNMKGFVLEEMGILIGFNTQNFYLVDLKEDQTYTVLKQTSYSYKNVIYLHQRSHQTSCCFLLLDQRRVWTVELQDRVKLRETGAYNLKLEQVIDSSMAQDESTLALFYKSNIFQLLSIKKDIQSLRIIKVQGGIVQCFTFAVLQLELFTHPSAFLCYIQEDLLILHHTQQDTPKAIRLADSYKGLQFSRVLEDMIFLTGTGQISALWFKVAPEWSRLSKLLVPITRTVTYREREDEFQEHQEEEEVGEWSGLSGEGLWCSKMLKELTQSERYLSCHEM